MVEKNINTIEELSKKSGVSKPKIYDFLNGENPFNSTYIRFCEFLEVSPFDLLEKGCDKNE